VSGIRSQLRTSTIYYQGATRSREEPYQRLYCPEGVSMDGRNNWLSRQRRHGSNIRHILTASQRPSPCGSRLFKCQFKLVALLSSIRHLVKSPSMTTLQMQKKPRILACSFIFCFRVCHSLGKTSSLGNLILPSTTRKSGTHLLQQNDRAKFQIIWDWYRIARILLLAAITLPVLPQDQ